MKCLIAFFSQSGGTRKAAEAIARGMRERNVACDCVTLENFPACMPDGYDLFGLGCPVFYYQEPFHVARFIDGLPDQNQALWFAFCSHGTHMGVTLQSMVRRLTARNARVIGCFDMYADGALPFYPSPTLTYGHPDQRDIAGAEAFGGKMAAAAAEASAGATLPDARPAPLPPEERWVLTELDLYQPDVLNSISTRLRIDTKRCTGCRTCERECPVGGIDISAKPPRIQAPCELCYRCAMTCPAGAVVGNYESLLMVAPASTARHKRSVDAAVRQGRFVYHMDPDASDYDDPLFVQQERNRGGPLQQYRLWAGWRLVRYAALHWGMRDLIFKAVRLQAIFLGKWKKRADLDYFY